MTTPSIVTPATLVGRERELKALGRLYDGSAARPRVVVVHGEAGVGKTRLVHEMAERARASGALVVGGRAHRFGADSSPYLPLLSVLRELDTFCGSRELPELKGLIASVGAAVDADSKDAGGVSSGRLVREIAHVLARAAVTRPTVVVVDDLQWADPTTMEVLAFLADGHETDRLSLVVVYRDEGLSDGHPLHSWLVDLRKALPVDFLPLARFTYEETAEHVIGLVGPEAFSRVNDVYNRSAGNPYLSELLCTDAAEASERGHGGDVGSTLRTVLLSSWHRLTPVARDVARVVSVGGRPGAIEVLSRVASTVGISTRESEAALREGIESGLDGVGGRGLVPASPHG